MNVQNPVCLPHDRVKGRLGLVTYNPDLSNRKANDRDDNKSEKTEYLKKAVIRLAFVNSIGIY